MKGLQTIIALLIFQFSFSQNTNTNTDVKGKLDIEAIDNVSVITAKASNTTGIYFSLKYVVSIIYPDNTENPPKDTNEDLFTLDPNQTKELYKTSLNTDVDNKINILLLIYNEDDILVAKDRIVINETIEDNPLLIEEDENDGIELLGIVTDETKTKYGRDFYDLFYSIYSYNKIEGSKVVQITEMRGFRSNTVIKIIIQEEVIFEFFARPDTEYLEEMSKIGAKKVYIYFQNLAKEKSYITRY